MLLGLADTPLGPGMTTSNGIETNTVRNALYVPLEAVAGEGTTPFVYKRDGTRVTKQQVETGLANENEIVIAKGLEKDDRVMLTAPADKDKMELRTLPGAKPLPPQPGPADTPSPAKPVPVKPVVPNAPTAAPAAATKS